MNAIYEYFFPTAPVAEQPKPKPEPMPAPTPVPDAPAAPAKVVSICFTHRDEICFVTLRDVEKMTLGALRHWRPMVTTHILETYDEDESENANIILQEMENRIQQLDTTTESQAPE